MDDFDGFFAAPHQHEALCDIAVTVASCHGHPRQERTLLARIDWGVTMDPVTSPLIHKDSGHQARVDPGEENPSFRCAAL